MTAPAEIPVAIVGGGASGLYAATLLEQQGVDSVIFEARDRIGGRLLSADVDGGRVDLGATWFWPNEPRINTLISDSDLHAFAQYVDGDMMYQPDASRARRLNGNQLNTPSGRVSSGMQSIPELLARQLTSTSTSIELSTVVTSLTLDRERVRVVTTHGDWLADHVILATPPALAMESIDFGDDLDDLVAGLARATPVWMGTTVKVVSVFGQAFWRDNGLAGSAFSYTGPMREIHDMSGADGTPAAIFGFCAVAPGAPAPSEDEIVHQLVELFGEEAASPRHVFIMDWRTEEYTSPSTVERLTNYQTYGHPEFQRPSFGGHLHWASTETSPVAPGHIEGAFAAAERAATSIINERSRSA